MSEPLSFDVPGIMRCQQNRYPLLFIDRVYDVIPGERAKGTKCFTYNEWYFPAHFEDDPNVPGFIQIECLVQTFIMTFLCIDKYQGMKTSFANIDNTKFKRKILPGETLTVEAELKSFKRGMAKGSASSFVDGEAACSADFVIVVPDVFKEFLPKE